MQDVMLWNTFFESFTSLRGKRSVEAVLSPVRYESFFSVFTSLYSAHRMQGQAVNLIDLLKVGRDELRNCALLAWLLDCSGSHGQGAAFLRCFLDCAQESGCPVAFPTDSAASGRYRTTLESSYDEDDELYGRQRSRVDIELDGDAFLLFIEAKVGAAESDGQLSRYLHIGRVRAGNRPWGLVFLTPTGRQSSDQEACDNATCLSWSGLGRRFLRHAVTMPPTHGSHAIRQVCEHFIRL